MRAGITNVSSTPLDERLDPPTSATTLFARLWSLLSSRYGPPRRPPPLVGHSSSSGRRRRGPSGYSLLLGPSSSSALLEGSAGSSSLRGRRIGPAAVALRSVTLSSSLRSTGRLSYFRQGESSFRAIRDEVLASKRDTLNRNKYLYHTKT